MANDPVIKQRSTFDLTSKKRDFSCQHWNS